MPLPGSKPPSRPAADSSATTMRERSGSWPTPRAMKSACAPGRTVTDASNHLRLAIGRQIGPGVARVGIGQGLLVPVRVTRSWEAKHRPLPGRGSLDDLEPVWPRRALGPGDPARPARCPHVVVGEEREAG